MPQKATLDSARTEEFIPMVPHRLPLPPLLASQVPALTSENPSASRPQPRLKLQTKASITAVEAPLMQQILPLSELPVEIDVFLQNLETRARETVGHLQSFCQLNSDKLKELQELRLACARGERPLAEALALFNAGVEYESSGNHQKASELFQSFLAPCQRAGYTPGLLTGLSALQVSYFLQQNYKEVINAGEQAIKLIDEAARIAEQTSGGWLTQSFMAASFLLNTALAFLELFDYEGATLALSRALQHALQTGDRTAEAAINAAQAACNALSGDFNKADSCLDRYVELAGIREVGLEGALGLKSVKAGVQGGGDMYSASVQGGYLIEARASPVAIQKQAQLAGLFLRVANLARFHGDLQKSYYYATRGYNLARRSGLQGLTAASACAMGIAAADQAANPSTTSTEPNTVISGSAGNAPLNLPEVKLLEVDFAFQEITL